MKPCRCEESDYASSHMLKRYQKGSVAQLSLRSDFPLRQADLFYGLCLGYAKSCEAIEDRGADLDLSNLALEVSCGEALT